MSEDKSPNHAQNPFMESDKNLKPEQQAGDGYLMIHAPRGMHIYQ